MRIGGPIRVALLVAFGFSVIALADPPASVAYSYDDAGRLRSATYSDGKVVDYQYDPAGNRTVVTNTPTATLAIASPLANVTEGGTLLFRVTRTGTNAQTITVDCKPVDGTAESYGPIAPWLDYSPTPSVISFLTSDPNPTTKNCSVVTSGDSIYEGPETVYATLSSSRGGALILPSGTSAPGTITDNDPAPTLSVAGEAKPEGTSLNFTLTKTGASEYAHDVAYATSDGTALTSDNDYTASSGVASFGVGVNSQTVTVATNADAKYEANETVTLTLSAPTAGAVLGTSSAAGTISNDDAAPSVAISDPPAVAEGAVITFTVTKTGSTGLSHSLNFATANGTALAPGDYVAGSGTVVFAAADTTKTIAVQSNTDALTTEGDETFVVNLTTNASTNGATIADSQGTGTISDPNSSVPSVPGTCRTNPTPISSGSYSVIWNASSGAVSTYVLEEDASGSDFTPPTATFTINAPTVFRAFTKNGNPLEFSYRVKACNASNLCSAFSNVAFIQVCSPSGVCN